MFERKGQKLGSVIADAVAEPGEVEEDVDPFDSTTVAEIKEQLAARGLPTSGNKAELWARLQEPDEADDDSKEDSDGDDDAS